MLSINFVLGMLLGTLLGVILTIIAFNSWSKVLKQAIKEYMKEGFNND